MTILKPSLTLLEKSINHYLSLDENSKQYLNQLTGKTIVFHLKRPKISTYFHFSDSFVTISREKPNTVDTEIYTSLLHLAKLKFQKRKNFVGNGFVIKGNIELAKVLNELFERHDIDWEEHLSKVTGDVFAHKAGEIFRKRTKQIRSSKESMVDNLGEYLQEESQFLPHKNAIKAFTNEVEELNLQTERLQARIGLLKRKLLDEEKRP